MTSWQGTVSLTPTSGVADFSNLVLITAANGYTIQATTTSNGVSSAVTNAFDVTAAPASQLVITSQPPGSVTAGTGFGLTVTAEDPYNNVATDYTGTIALALESNPGNADAWRYRQPDPNAGCRQFHRAIARHSRTGLHDPGNEPGSHERNVRELQCRRRGCLPTGRDHAAASQRRRRRSIRPDDFGRGSLRERCDLTDRQCDHLVAQRPGRKSA